MHKTYEDGFEARTGAAPDVVLGIRPDALAPATTARFAAAGPELAMKMKVWLVQPLGATMDIYLQTDRHERTSTRRRTARRPTSARRWRSPSTRSARTSSPPDSSGSR